jgi:hypothetical protein
VETARSAQQEFIDQARELWTELMDEPIDAIAQKMAALAEIQTEYQGWLDGMSENLQSSAAGEKLASVCELDLEFEVPDEPEIQVDFDLDTIEGQVDEAEGADLPVGFGRD